MAISYEQALAAALAACDAATASIGVLADNLPDEETGSLCDDLKDVKDKAKEAFDAAEALWTKHCDLPDP
jgi:hypothetical protein